MVSQRCLIGIILKGNISVVTQRFQGPAGAESPRQITPAMQDYLKAAYCLHQEGNLVATGQLSQALGLSDVTVTKMIKRLHKARLVCHTRYRGIVLTEEGAQIASKVLRRHHLIALYLVETFGYNWDEVEQEAESPLIDVLSCRFVLASSRDLSSRLNP